MIKQMHRGTAVFSLVLCLALTMGIASCGSGDATESEASAEETQAPTPGSTGADTTETAGDDEAATETSAQTDTTTETDETEPVEEAIEIDISVSGGTVTVDEDRVEVPLGSEVVIGVEADVADEVHLHGYDLTADASPGVPAELRFVADTPGVFEVELESSATFLVEIEVS